jgi:hypothetical protein
MSEDGILEVLQSSDDASTLLHLLLMLRLDSPRIASACIDLYLRNTNPTINSELPDVLRRQSISPSDEQCKRFESILFACEDDDGSKLETLLGLAPLFIKDALSVFRRFRQFGRFVDRSDSNVLLSLGNLALKFHEQLFSEFSPADFGHWACALRLLSDENPAMRLPCCQALSYHFSDKDGLEMCEFDLIRKIYELIQDLNVLQRLLKEFKEVKEDGGESHFKKEPVPFLFPPSFHIECIKNRLKQIVMKNK